MTNNKSELETLANEYFIIKLILWLYKFFINRLQNPKWLLMLVLTRFKTVTPITIFYNSNKFKEESLTSSFQEINGNNVVESLTKDGFYLGLKLPESILQELLSFASCTDCYGDGKYQLGFAYAEKEKAEKKYGHFIRGHYFSTLR